jgi:hypothetical protein
VKTNAAIAANVPTGGCSLHRPVRPLFVRMFKPQFASLVESGAKCQTVRPTPKRIPKAGDLISLRCWTGAPYRSKQRVLREATIVAVRTIHFAGYFFDGGPRDAANKEICLNDFAKADGFSSWREMVEWFDETHGLPFEGIVIHWSNALFTNSAPEKPTP